MDLTVCLKHSSSCRDKIDLYNNKNYYSSFKKHYSHEAELREKIIFWNFVYHLVEWLLVVSYLNLIEIRRVGTCFWIIPNNSYLIDYFFDYFRNMLYVVNKLKSVFNTFDINEIK